MQPSKPAEEWVNKDEIYTTKMSKRRKMLNKQRPSFAHVEQAGRRPPLGRAPLSVVKHHRGLFTDIPGLPLYTILTYDFSAFRKYLAVCPCWYRALISAFDELCNRIENDFTMKYH